MAPTLVLLAAGRSTRFGAPKQLAPLGPGGASLLAYTVVDALRAGFGSVVAVTTRSLLGPLQDHLAQHLGGGVPVQWACQRLDDLPPALCNLAATRSRPWGTAHALLAAEPHVADAFGVANADDWYGPDALAALARTLSGPSGPAAPVEGAGRLGPPERTQDSPGRRDSDARAPETSGEYPCAAVVVGYPMEGTLSPGGGVSRGWIRTGPGDAVVRVVELREVRRGTEGRLLGVDPEGRPVSVPPGSAASMNLWGFQRCLLAELRQAFHTFLVERGADAAAEFALSQAVDQLLEEGRLRLRLLPANSPWFGVTHPGDADPVRQRLEGLHRDGTYATPLAATLERP
ncbi:MAG: NTP transferase domain-containing protein [Longimicrobiales bacterium]|nr:NTP transferase domain-containing protein [Longimicrobiales bacterium]